MEYTSKEILDKSKDPYLCMIQQINEFSQKQLSNVRCFINAIDHHIANQRSKQMFQAFSFLQESTLAFSDLQAYFTRLMVKMTEFPSLVDLAKGIQYFITESIKLYTFTNECWFARVRQLETTLKHFHRSQPPMQVCLKCSQNIRHQQIKQARFYMFNLIDDPYLFYQREVSNKNAMYQETGQKSLQDKLSELASGVQFGQICMRQLIQNLTTQGKELFLSKENTHKEEDLQFIPILRSLAKHVKAEKKETFPIGVQTELTQLYDKNANLSSNNAENQGQPKQVEKEDPKLALELNEKIKEIKSLQQKLQEQSKILDQYKTQINVLKQDQNTLQKRNSILEIQLNWSKSRQKQIKPKKGHQVRNNNRNNSEVPLNLQAIRQYAGFQDQRTSKIATESKYENKFSKTEFSSSSVKKPINLASITNPYSQNPQRTYRKTQNAFNYERGSTQSIERRDQKQQNYIIDYMQGQFPRLGSSKMNVGFKNELYDFNSLNSSILDIGKQTQQNRLKMTKLITSDGPFSEMKRKNRRIGTVYDKQLLLKLLHQKEVKSNRSTADFQYFKNTYESCIQKLAKIDEDSTKQNTFSLEKVKAESKHKKLTRHLQKKSTASIRTFHKNQLISKDQNQIKLQIENAQKNQNLEQAEKSQNNAYGQKNSKSLQSRKSLKVHLKTESLRQLITEEQRKIIYEVKSSLSEVEVIPLKEHKRIVLNKKEHNITTEIMAYLVQLKVQNKLVYDELRKVLSSFDRHNKSPEKQEKEAIQISITQIINNHRCCPRLHANNFCGHLKNLVTSITKLME